VKLDFETLKVLSEIARNQYGLAGAVQHGASTLPAEAFHKFAECETAEVHLATEFQNMIYESRHFPAELRTKIYDWLKVNAASERKEGETEEQFERTISLYEEIGFDISYNAIYSPRSGTAASRAFKDDVPREEKRRRWDRLQEVMERVVRKKNQAYLGKEASVLVERCEPPHGPNLPSMCFGNSREMKLVTFPGRNELVGQIVPVKIIKPEMWILYGERIT